MDALLEAAKLVNSTDDFQRKINDLVKAKTEAEEAQQLADRKKAEAADTIAQVERTAMRRKAELAEAQKKHDAAANEAAARIKLVTEGQAKIDRRSAELDAREVDLKRREETVASVSQTFESALRQLVK